MKKPCSEMFCLRNQDITDAKAFFYLFFMSNSGYLVKARLKRLLMMKGFTAESYRISIKCLKFVCYFGLAQSNQRH